MRHSVLRRLRRLRVSALHLVCAGALLVALGVPRAEAGPFDGTIWAVLSEQEQATVLQTLENELLAVQNDRAAQSAADDAAGKTLDQLLDELYTPQTPTTWRTYSSKYADMALRAMAADSVRFARIAGSASAGDYSGLQKELPRVGASLFAQMVGDALEARGHDQTKVVWEGLVARAGNLQQIGVAFLRGDSDQAFNLAKAQARAELETLSENAVAGMINWVFTDLGLSPGQAYLQVIRYERQFITWSQAGLTDYFIQDCLDRYVSTYDQTNGNIYASMEEFDLCAIPGGAAFGDRELTRAMQALVDARIDIEPFRRQMLEAYRQTGQMPRSWIRDLVDRKMAEAEQKLTADLADTQQELEASSDVFGQALGRRLAALALAAMSEEDAAALVQAARDAIKASEDNADAVARAAGGAVAACGAYDAARADAIAARAAMRELDSIAFDIRTRARAVPECDGDGGTIVADLAEARRLQGVFNTALAEAEAGLNAACTARDGVEPAPDQPTALQRVQAARDGAARAAAGVEAGRQAHADFTAILQRVAAAGRAQDPGVNLDIVRADLARLDAAIAELNAADAATIAADFATAKGAMATALRQASNLLTHGEQRADLVSAALEPHRASPLGAEIDGILQGLETALEPAQACQYRITQDWSGSGRWTYRSIEDPPDLAGLQTLIDAAKDRCPIAATNTQGQPPEQVIAEIYIDVDASTVLLDIAQRGYEQCLAEAMVTYSDVWGMSDRPPVTLAQSILIVLDASGSMGDESRIEQARAAAAAVLQGIPVGGDTEVALMVFYDCGNIQLEVPFTTDPNEVIAVLPNISPSGSTPLAAATAEGRDYLRTEAQGARKRFVLLTDGEESCGGDPVAAIGQ